MKRLCLLIVLFGTIGCASVVPNGTKYEPTNADSIKIYQYQALTGEYEKIGRVSVGDSVMGRSQEDYYTLMRKKAAEIGGDAVIEITQDIGGGMRGVVIKMKSKWWHYTYLKIEFVLTSN